MVERLQEILNSKLDMVSKMEAVKNLLKEFHEHEDLDVLFNLLTKKTIYFKTELKVQELEILALRELIIEKIENSTKEELDEFNKFLTIKSLENQMKMQEINIIDSNNMKEKYDSLTKDDYNLKRAVYDYSINNATKEAKEVTENEIKKVELKNTKQELDIINLYKTIVARKINKNKKIH